MADLHDLSATELLAAYRSKQLSPVEVTRAVLAHIRAWEPHLHATYAHEGDESIVQAEASQARWLKGAPISPLDGAQLMQHGAPRPAHCHDSAARSLAKIGELLHSPLSCFLPTANCGSWYRYTLTESVASWRWMSPISFVRLFASALLL